MKAKPKKAKTPHVVKVPAYVRNERMHAYMKMTRPAFEQAVEKAITLGKAANGVLAGPLARV